MKKQKTDNFWIEFLNERVLIYLARPTISFFEIENMKLNKFANDKKRPFKKIHY